jgi:DNA-directed RNA polymerase specialized sigma24 family protein
MELDEMPEDLAPRRDQIAAREEERVSASRWSSLGSGSQEILRLHFIEEISYADLASRLDRAESTLRVRVFQCMKQIRSLLREDRLA